MSCSIQEKPDRSFFGPEAFKNEDVFGNSVRKTIFAFMVLFMLLLFAAGSDVKAQAMVPRSNTAKMRQAWSEPRSRNRRLQTNDRNAVSRKRGRTDVFLAGPGHPGGIRGSSPRAMSVHQIPPAWSPEEPHAQHPDSSEEESASEESGKEPPNEPQPSKPDEQGPRETPTPPAQSPTEPPSQTAQAPAPAAKPLPIRGSEAEQGGAACMAVLKKYGVSFVEEKAVTGIRTPIKLTGPINGITYRSRWTPDEEPVMDCLLALALLRASNIFKAHDVDLMVYSSIYRPPRRNRPSRHAQGLAIDVRDVTFKDRVTLNVLRDWRKAYGRPDNCVGEYTTDNSVRLRRIICDLEETNIFRRILTPDSDPDHEDHFHISAGMSEESWERSRWAGRNLYQPLPGTRLFPSWYEWYGCYRKRGRRAVNRCYNARRPSWVASGNPYRFKTHRYKSFLGTELASMAHTNKDKDENNNKTNREEGNERNETESSAAKETKNGDEQTELKETGEPSSSENQQVRASK